MERMQDRRAGEIVALLYNINRDSKKYPKDIRWDDVFPDPTQQQKAPQSEEEMFATMMLFARASQRKAQPS